MSRTETDQYQDDDWTELAVYDTFLHVIARISARMFVGLPLC